MEQPDNQGSWRRLAPLFLAVAVLAIGLNIYQFFAGLESGTVAASGEDPATTAEAITPSSPAIGKAPETSAVETTSATMLTAGPEETAAFEVAPLDRLRAAFEDTDPISRTEKFLHAARRLSIDEYAEAFEVLEEIPRDARFGSELRMMIDLWVRADAKKALEYFAAIEEENPGRENGWKTSEAIRLWVERDPNAAVQWVQQNGAESEEGNPYLASAIRALAKTDNDWAGELAQTLPYGKLRGEAVHAVLKVHLENGGAERAFEYVEGIGDDKLREGAYGITIGQLVQDDPEEAVKWVEATPSEKLRARTLPHVISEWADDDPNAAGEWLNAQSPSPELDRTVRAFADRISREDPAAAWAWASTITTENLRFDAYKNIFGRWNRVDPGAARQQFMESDVPDQWKAKVGAQP